MKPSVRYLLKPKAISQLPLMCYNLSTNEKLQQSLQ